MNKTIPGVLAIILFVSTHAAEPARAEPAASMHATIATDVSLGVVMGEPTGISGRLGLGKSAFAVAAGVDFDDHTHVHGDYQYTVAYLTSGGNVTIPIYFGLGLFLKDHPEDIAAHGGARIPFGIQVDFSAPVQLYGEIAPNIVLVEPDEMLPHDPVTLNGAVGVRARF